MGKLRRFITLAVLSLFVFASAALPASVRAVSPVSEVASGTSGSDLATYTIPTATVNHDARLLLYITSGRTDGTAAAASSVAGMGGAWQEVRSLAVNSGNLYSSVYTAPVTAGSGTIDVVFPAVQQNFSWRLLATADESDTIAQSVAAYSSSTTPTATLPGLVASGSTTVGFISALSTSQTITPGAGFTETGAQYTNTTPTIRGAAEWRTGGSQAVGFTTSGTTQKTVIAIEITPGGYEEPPTSDKTQRVAVIGDSLTYQDGLGEANIAQSLVASGYSASNVYVYGVGGKKITAKDSRGKTTVQNIAEARAQLGAVDIWLIALGTNNVSDSNTTFVANVNTILDTIGSTDKVVWVGLGYYRVTNSNAARFNPLLQSTVGARANGTYADWNSFIHNGRDETGLWIYPTDSTHMTQAGYAVRNQFFVSQIDAVQAGL